MKSALPSILQSKNYDKLILCILIFTGAILRFTNLNWGVPFLHPDEYNIGLAISRIQFPSHLNPEFFAYGSLPIYLVYGIGVFFYSLTNGSLITQLHADQAILIGRFCSAFFAVLLIPLMYVLANQIGLSKKYQLGTAYITAFLVGLIQYGHFATFESWLTFLYIAITVLSLSIISKPSIKKHLLLGILIGVAIGTKIVSLYLIVIPFVINIVQYIQTSEKRDPHKSVWHNFTHSFSLYMFFNRNILLTLFSAIVIFICTNPFTFLDYESFINSFTYERTVATGTLPVFYTRTFTDTTPFVFQIINVFPFISSPLFTYASFVLIITLLFWSLIQTTDASVKTLLLSTVFWGYLIPHMSFYVKWTRYMVPALPFLGLALMWGADILQCHIKRVYMTTISSLFLGIILFGVGFRGLSFFTMYLQPDSRVQAAAWAAKLIPSDATILSETYDPNIIPFNKELGNQITLINMYDLYDVNGLNNLQLASLTEKLATSDYIILPSERVYKTALRLSDRYPITAQYYKKLFDGSLGFVIIFASEPEPCLIAKPLPPYQFYPPPESYIRNTLCPIATDTTEETFTIFDHPAVKVLKKIETKTSDEYHALLVESLGSQDI